MKTWAEIVGALALTTMALGACSGHTTPAQKVTATSAELHSTVQCGPNSIEDACYAWYAYRAHPDGAWQVTHLGGPGHPAPTASDFPMTVAGLSPGTAYDYAICGIPGQRNAPTSASYNPDLCADSTGTAGGTNFNTFTTAYQIPDSIPADCSADASQALLYWIASVPSNSILSLGHNACYRIDGTLTLFGRTGLAFEGNGATFKRMTPPGDQSAVWRVWQSTGLKFANLTVDGDYPTPGTFNASVQHAHGFDLRGTGADIAGVTIKDVGGDCVYYGLGSDSQTRSTGSFHDSTCAGTSRNGVAVTAGNDITVQRDTINAIGYATFDVEPNIASGNWGASGITFDSNTLGTSHLYVYSIVENGPISRLTFANNTVRGQPMGINVAPGSAIVSRPQDLSITGNSSDTAQAPPAMTFDSVDTLTVTGNTVPLTSGAMATVSNSCNVNISGNRYPGGSQEVSFTSGCP
jgi:hypothetical protein